MTLISKNMKKTYFTVLLLAVMIIMTSTNLPVRQAGKSASVRDGFVNGTPDVKSISALSFGPDGILFIGDSKSATVFAIDTKDTEKVEKATAVDVKKFDQKVATVLGTEVANISFQDLAVNPVSKKIYCAVQLADGTPALLKVEGDKITSVSLKEVSYASTAINNAPAEDAKDQRGRPLRGLSISD